MHLLDECTTRNCCVRRYFVKGRRECLNMKHELVYMDRSSPVSEGSGTEDYSCQKCNNDIFRNFWSVPTAEARRVGDEFSISFY